MAKENSLDRQLVALIYAAFPLGSPIRAPNEFCDETWRALVEAARRHGLTGLLDHAVETLGRDDIPRSICESLRTTLRQTILAASLAYRELGDVIAKCAREKIPIVVLKGAALAKTLYPEAALRPFGDLDLMLRREDAPRLRTALLSAGMKENDELARGFNESYLGEMAFFPRAVHGVALDLHWELVSPAYYRRRMSIEWFWQNTETASFGGYPTQVLNPTAQLVHLAVHAGLHHQDRLRLIWLYDLALLIKRRGAEIDWRAADQFAQEATLARPICAILEQIQDWWSIELPREANHLFQPPRLDLHERMVYALTTTPFTEARTLLDVLDTPGWNAKLRFAREQLFPNAAYMRSRYNMTNAALLPLYYARRLAESTFKFTRSLLTAATR